MSGVGNASAGVGTHGASANTDAVVDVRDLEVTFRVRNAAVKAVNGVSFKLHRSKTLCVIGESGSGKSVMMRALMRLNAHRQTETSGYVRVAGHGILSLSERAMTDVRGSTISMIFQEPMTALDPVYRVGHQIAEGVRQHERISWNAAMSRALDLLKLVRVPSPERRLNAFPHELSGGLRQRVMIAMALSCKPDLLLADEPTTALDVSVQIQVLALLRRLQDELGMAMIFVTHDIGVAAQLADDVAVMYAGRFIEQGSVAEVLGAPKHPYTRGMLASIIDGSNREKRIPAILGNPPNPQNLPRGCSFAPRCERQIPACARSIPPAVSVGHSHSARCIRVDDALHSSFSN